MRIDEEIKSKFESNVHRATINLMFTYSWMMGIQNQHFKQFGISAQQFNVLRILRDQHPNPASVKLIAERMIDKNSNASRLVDKLLDKGLVERRNCEHDRRQVDVVITKKGLELAEKAARFTRDNTVMHLSEEEAQTLSNLLDKMRG